MRERRGGGPSWKPACSARSGVTLKVAITMSTVPLASSPTRSSMSSMTTAQQQTEDELDTSVAGQVPATWDGVPAVQHKSLSVPQVPCLPRTPGQPEHTAWSSAGAAGQGMREQGVSRGGRHQRCGSSQVAAASALPLGPYLQAVSPGSLVRLPVERKDVPACRKAEKSGIHYLCALLQEGQRWGRRPSLQRSAARGHACCLGTV